MKNIGILGYGNVGRATTRYLADPDRYFVVVDDNDSVQREAIRTHGAHDTVSHLDALIICVGLPHPMACDLRHVKYENAMAQFLCDSLLDIQHLLSEGVPILVRTTVPPGTCDALQKLFPNNPVMAWPEFSKEASMRLGYEIKAPYLGLHPASFDEDVGDGMKVASMILEPSGLAGEVCSSQVYQNTQVEFMKLAWNVKRAADVAVFNQLSHAAQDLGFDPIMADHLAEQSQPTAPQFSTLAFGGACLDKDLNIWDASFKATLGVSIRTINRTGPLHAMHQAFKAAQVMKLPAERTVILGLQDGPSSNSSSHSPAMAFMRMRKWERPPIFVDSKKKTRDHFAWLLDKAGHEDYASVCAPDSTAMCYSNMIIIAQKSNDNTMLNALKTILQGSEAPVKIVVNAAGVFLSQKDIIDCQKWGAVFIDKQEIGRMTKA